MEFFRPEYWRGWPFPSPGDLPSSGIEPSSPTLQADSSPAEPQGKPKNTEVGNLSLLWGIFPTQDLNQSLLHCRKILYQLSYQGSPSHKETGKATSIFHTEGVTTCPSGLLCRKTQQPLPVRPSQGLTLGTPHSFYPWVTSHRPKQNSKVIYVGFQ